VLTAGCAGNNQGGAAQANVNGGPGQAGSNGGPGQGGPNGGGPNNGGFQNPLSSLTQTQQDAYRQAMSDSLKTNLADLVTNGTITQDIADQITAMNTPGNGGFRNGGNGGNGQGSNNGNSNSNSNNNGNNQGANGGNAAGQGGNGVPGRGPMSNLTDDQRTAVQKAQTDARTAALASLVQDGTLTQTEADTLTQAMQNMPNGGNRPNRQSPPPDTTTAANP